MTAATGHQAIRIGGLGRIYRPRWKRKNGKLYQSPYWWIAFYHRGKEIRESSNSRKESDAKKLLKQKATAIQGGNIMPREDKITFDELAIDIENDYRVNSKRTLPDLSYRIGHLREFFGMDRAIDIRTDRVRAYQRKRLDEGAAPATVNRELAALRRMLSLALSAGKLSRVPKIEMLAENNIRESFLEHGDFMALLAALPEPARDLVEFEYLSGWRQGAVKKLQ